MGRASGPGWLVECAQSSLLFSEFPDLHRPRDCCLLPFTDGDTEAQRCYEGSHDPQFQVADSRPSVDSRMGHAGFLPPPLAHLWAELSALVAKMRNSVAGCCFGPLL